jgi:hypothetical protein
MLSKSVSLLPRLPLVSRRTRQKQPAELLPVELWEAIFQAASSDDDLLSVAFVCRVFNALCIRILLAEYNAAGEVFSSKLFSVSHNLLRIFHRSFRTFLLERLTFQLQLQSLEIPIFMGYLLQITLRSSNLRELDIMFDSEGDILSVFAERTSRVVCAFLAAMSKRAPGPMFVLSPFPAFSCRPDDVTHWRLHLLRLNTPQGVRGLVTRLRNVPEKQP